jgi:hypothetical protein
MAKEDERRLKSSDGNKTERIFLLNYNSLFCLLDAASGMDHDAYEHYIENLCTNKTRLFETVLKISPEIIDHVRVSMSNPFKKKLGQLTVYRLRLHFTKGQCEEKDPTKCQLNLENNDLLSFKQQIWPAYMGMNGDCHANNRF